VADGNLNDVIPDLFGIHLHLYTTFKEPPKVPQDLVVIQKSITTDPLVCLDPITELVNPSADEIIQQQTNHPDICP
jgi:hypothetical protein